MIYVHLIDIYMSGRRGLVVVFVDVLTTLPAEALDGWGGWFNLI